MNKGELTHIGLMLLGASAGLTLVSFAPLGNVAYVLHLGAILALLMALVLLVVVRMMR